MTTSALARLLHPTFAEAKYIAVCKFFGDETGIDNNSRICAVSGFVGTEKEWERFDRNWKKVLDAEGIPYFHAVACERGKDDFYGLDVLKRGRIVDRLLQVIMNSSIRGYSYGLVKPHFEAWNEKDRIHFTNNHPDNPYYLCLQTLFVFATDECKDKPDTEQIHFVFEKQEEFKEEAEKVYDDLKSDVAWESSKHLGKLCFEEEPAKYPGIQAADLLAYETFRQLDNKYFQPGLRPEWKNRIAIKVLWDKMKDGRYLDSEGFAHLSRTRSIRK